MIFSDSGYAKASSDPSLMNVTKMTESNLINDQENRSFTSDHPDAANERAKLKFMPQEILNVSC